MSAERSRLLQSNRSGWAMAAPAFALMSLFIILPFIFAFGLSFTNQRLFSSFSVPLAEIKHIAKALDASLNDVVLAICGIRSASHRPRSIGAPVERASNVSKQL